MSNALIHTSHRHRLDTHQTVTRVEQNNAERLSSQHAHFTAQQFMNQFRRIEFLLEQWFLRETFPQIKRSDQFQCLGGTNSLDCPKLVNRKPTKFSEGLEFVQNSPTALYDTHSPTHMPHPYSV